MATRTFVWRPDLRILVWQWFEIITTRRGVATGLVTSCHRIFLWGFCELGCPSPLEADSTPGVDETSGGMTRVNRQTPHTLATTPYGPAVSPCAKSALMGSEVLRGTTNEPLGKRFDCGELMQHEDIEQSLK